MLQTNIGTLDRSFRLVIGLGLLLWFFLDQGTGFWHYAKLIGLVAIFLRAAVGGVAERADAATATAQAVQAVQAEQVAQEKREAVTRVDMPLAGES